MKVNGIIELGGILSFIGNVATVPLIELGIDLGTGFPIPQHPGTGPVSIDVPVTNYALSIDASPDTLLVRPGVPSAFGISVRNEGTTTDTIDNFKYTLSNRPLSGGSFGKLFSHNNDFDCLDDTTKAHYFGNPYDGKADECYDANGNPLSGRTEQVDEDGVGDSKTGDGSNYDQDKDGDGIANEDPGGDDWIASFSVPEVANILAELRSKTPIASQSLLLHIR